MHTPSQPATIRSSWWYVARLIVFRPGLYILSALGIPNHIADVMPKARHSWSWADRHMETTLPLHWQAFQEAANGVLARSNAQVG